MRLSGRLCSWLVSKPEIMSKSLSFQEFKALAHLVHNCKYKYKESSFKSSSANTEILCPEHGPFIQRAAHHISGSGCPMCGHSTGTSKRSKPFSEFLKEADEVHGNTQTYDEKTYATARKPLRVSCLKHGDYWASPSNILKGHKCPKCAMLTVSQKFTKPWAYVHAKFRRVHGDAYQYFEDSYVDAKTPMEMWCDRHGQFRQTPNDHGDSGTRCPACAGSVSKGQLEITNLVRSILPDEIFTDHIYDKQTSRREVDIYIPSHNLAIEFNGTWWHSSKFKENKYHYNKQQELAKLGIRCIQIFSDEWEYRPEQVKTLLVNALNKSNITTYARKTTITELPHFEAKDFHDLYHIQGSHHGGLSYGLEFEGNLVAVMSLKNNNDSTYELVRFSSKGRVPGAASKLLKHFIKENKSTKIISFSDNRLFSGKMYQSLGFQNEGQVQPSYTYVTQASSQREHKFNFRHQRLARRFPESYNPNLAEKQNCELAGYFQVWDCGLTRWKLNLED